MHFQDRFKSIVARLAIATSLSAQLLCPADVLAGNAVSIGVVNPIPSPPVARMHLNRSKRAVRQVKGRKSSGRKTNARVPGGSKAARRSKTAKPVTPKLPPKPPQDVLDKLSKATLAPGVVHKCHRGALNINILDVDLNEPGLEVKPVLAGDSFNRLDEVRDQAQKVNAIAAVNANYFKKDGTPLGTLIIDGEWIAGPLYDRISFGLAENGLVHVDRANLHGTIESSNPEVTNLWVNNINQPRRSGAKLIVYTRRWGGAVKMAYAGCLVAVDNSGRVVDKTTQHIGIPYGGFVLSDTKSGAISKLKRGDLVFLEWHHRPVSWANVVQAVSGGPGLIRNGKLYVDLKDEHFRKTWTSSTIHARTALGVTRNKHLILVTVEGAHTLWDLAKMLQKLGCVEAMNLDGGGSTTMVVNGKIVTRNKNTYQRRVACSLAVLPRRDAPSLAARRFGNFVPQTDLSSGGADPVSEISGSNLPETAIADPLASDINEKLLKEEPAPEVKATGLTPDLVLDESAANENEGRSSKKAKKKKKEKHESKYGWMKHFKF